MSQQNFCGSNHRCTIRYTKYEKQFLANRYENELFRLRVEIFHKKGIKQALPATFVGRNEQIMD